MINVSHLKIEKTPDGQEDGIISTIAEIQLMIENSKGRDSVRHSKSER
jgi:hypothetical protein